MIFGLHAKVGVYQFIPSPVSGNKPPILPYIQLQYPVMAPDIYTVSQKTRH